MTKLTCHVSNCVSNSQGLCCRPDVTVEGSGAHTTDQTFCQSFGHRTESLLSAMPEIVPCEQTEVHCDAHGCAHNCGNLCAAEHVCVEGDGACECTQTRCKSFKKAR